MNFNIDISAITEWLKRFTTPYPARDWLVLLSSAVCIFLIGAALGAYIFLGVKTGSLIEAGSTGTKPPAPLPRAEIQKVLEIYKARVANYQSGNIPAYPLNDPHSSGTKK